MIKTEILLPYGYTEQSVRAAIVSRLPVEDGEIKDVRIVKRELCVTDADEPVYKTQVAFSSDGLKERSLLRLKNKVREYDESVFLARASSFSLRPVVVGAGPAGLFAALALAESGACPIVLERGLSVDERAERIAAFNATGILDTECNVQFGEGGAGAYSDGKLKVGAHDKYKLKVLTELVKAGADESIMYSTSAHLGTDRLPSLVRAIRDRARSLGAEFVFSARLTDIRLKDGRVVGVCYRKDGELIELPTEAVLLATGHSAKDTIEMLREKGIPMSPKGFGIGLRIEHPREYINGLIYRGAADKIEQTASYHLVTHLPNGRSVYSFCMCPGGSVVAAASEDGGIVTNGMSPYDRKQDNSNAALLVSVNPSDFGSDDALAGLALQRKIERAAYSLTSDYRAPSVRLGYFLDGRVGDSLGSVTPTYPRGVEIHSPDEYMPDYVCQSLRLAIPELDAWLPGYLLADAVLTGPETRTTSPIRIERLASGEIPSFAGVYPVGEGAGYAGGIVSSAVDGLKMAEKLIEKHLKA